MNMMPNPVFLWTDILIFVLVFAIIAFVRYASRREHLRASWRYVVRSPMGLVTMVILSCYVLVALLDSIHFQMPLNNGNGANGAENAEVHYSSEVLSVFDVLMASTRDMSEKTYSAPLATHLFSKENIEQPDGSLQRDFPRLKYGGAALDDLNDHSSDIWWHAAMGAFSGLMVWAMAVLVLLIVLAKRRHTTLTAIAQSVMRRDGVPLIWILITLGLLAVIVAAAMMLSTQYHVFGTDKVGEDVLYQTLKSIRTALALGTLTTLIMLPFAILLGIMAGYFRGWVDDVIQYVYTTLNSIPGVLLIAAAILMLQVYINNHADLFLTDAARADVRLLSLCLILGVTSWTGLCRLLRGETMKLCEVEYIQSARAFGVRHFTIIGRHILPNVMHLVLIAVVLDFSGLVLAEAVLSYVGVGVDPSMNSWGNMINGARLEMAREPAVWWSLLSAFVFMFVLVLAANLFSDVVRDAFDPRIQND